MQKITNFFKYNNAFIIIIGFLFLAAGSSFASETVRDAVIGQTIEEVRGMDNSALLAANLSSLKQEMSITDVSEDEANYFVAYSFSTFDIKDNAWQNQTKNQTLKVPKDALNGGKDLGLYVQSELAQVMDGQLAYLKDAQEKEKDKGVTKPIKTVKYTGLKGLVLNSETKELEGYEPVVKKAERIEEPYVPPQTASVADLAVKPPSETSAGEASSPTQESGQASSESSISSSQSFGDSSSSSLSLEISSGSSLSSYSSSSSSESSASSNSSSSESSSQASAESSSSSIASSSSVSSNSSESSFSSSLSSQSDISSSSSEAVSSSESSSSSEPSL